MIAFLLPAAAGMTYAFLSLISKRDSVRERSASFEATFWGLVFRIVLFIVALHAVVLGSLASGRNFFPRAVPILLGLAIVAVGDLLPRLRPNLAIGLRTTATFMNRELWMRTHRVAGYALVMFGAIILVTGLFLPPRIGADVILASGTAAAAALVWYRLRVSRHTEMQDDAINKIDAIPPEAAR